MGVWNAQEGRSPGFLRIVAWNANGGAHRKLEALARLRPDVAVVPECANEDVMRAKAGLFMEGVSMIWVGDDPNKGLAVFAFGESRVALDQVCEDPVLRWIAPVRVSGPVVFNLLAVWASNQRDTNYRPKPWQTQPNAALAVYESFVRSGPTVMAGDFNNGAYWDQPGKPGNFEHTAAAARTLGLRSAYHVWPAEIAFGDEPDFTHYWQTRTPDVGYHIDYVFVPATWLTSVVNVRVGTYDEWVADRTWTGRTLSDHVPVVVDLAFRA